MPSHSIVFWGSSVQNLQKGLIQLPTDSIPLPPKHTHTHKPLSQNQDTGKLLLETTAKGNSKPQSKIWTRFPRNHS